MSFILKAEGYHDKAVAHYWQKHFEILCMLIPDEKVRTKVLKVMSSCRDEREICDYYHIVQRYTEMLSFFNKPSLANTILHHMIVLKRFL